MAQEVEIGRQAKVRVAVDIGGTFTDIQVLDEGSGRHFAHKVASQPDNPGAALAKGLEESAARFGFGLDQVTMLIHGTTIATNAVLQNRLPQGALITTAGFEDVLEIGRHLRRDVYANKAEQRRLLIPRSRRFGVRERISATGDIERPLDEAHLDQVIEKIRAADCACLAICCLNAQANPKHEETIAAALAKAIPDLPLSLSSDISPEIREFERSSTTALNALLLPVVGGYLAGLEATLQALGLQAPIYLVQSNGGLARPAVAARQPARLLLSGPCGGAKAAEVLAQRLGRANLVAVDMGGTSYDVSLIQAGKARLINEGEVDGCPVRLPMVEMRTIGAGGGSLAKVDEAGFLQVGPQSAGALPGPACYSRGGEDPTVTDANCHLRRIAPDSFLNGAMRLDSEAAGRAIDGKVAAPLKLDADQAAEGLLQVAVNHMAGAIRLSLFEKGLDPADFVLTAFGGAAGLHACETAEELGMSEVLFPRDPGTLSAWGMLFADIQHDLSRALLLSLGPDAVTRLAPAMQAMEAQGRERLRRDAIAEGEQSIRFFLDLRYPGQAYEITVPLASSEDWEEAAQAFHRLHLAQFSHCEPDSRVEAVTLRMTAGGRLPKPSLSSMLKASEGQMTNRRVYLQGHWQDIPVYERSALRGKDVPGPLVIGDPHATLLITPDWSAAGLEDGSILARRLEGRD